MRYLTHDAEDTFWEAQGAKPHPLAAHEAEQRREAEKRRTTPLVHSYQNVTIPITPGASIPETNGPSSSPSNDHLVSNGKVSTPPLRPKSQGELVPPPSVAMGDNRRYSSSSTLRSDESTPPSQHRDTTHMSDEEVTESEEHAKRVGYKVSTV